MKLIKFLSLILIITCTPTLFAMEEYVQQQSSVPTLINLCLPKAAECLNKSINQNCSKVGSFDEALVQLDTISKTVIISFDCFIEGLADCLYRSNEIFQTCIDLVVNEIEKRSGDIFNQDINAINQDIFSHIPEAYRQLIKTIFCKRKGWYVPHCLKKLDNVFTVTFFPNGSSLFVRYEDNRVELLNAKNGEAIKSFDNVKYPGLSTNGSSLFVRYEDNRGELRNTKNGEVIEAFDDVNSARFSTNGSSLFIRYEDNRGELRNTKNGEVIEAFDDVKSAGFSYDDSCLSINYMNGTRSTVDIRKIKIVRENCKIIDRRECLPDNSIRLINIPSSSGHYAFIPPPPLPGPHTPLPPPRGHRILLIDTKRDKTIKSFDNVRNATLSPDTSTLFIGYPSNNSRSRGELLTIGSFDQVLFKLALSNMLETYKDQKNIINRTIRRLMRKAVPADRIKRNLETLSTHEILDTFPQPAQEKIKEKITNTLKDIKTPIDSLPPRSLTDTSSINARRIINKKLKAKLD